MKRDKRLDKAAEQLADLFEKHVAKLPPSEREAKRRAFRQAVARIGTGTKSAEYSRTQTTRRTSGDTNQKAIHSLKEES